jgi:hypothetical protein
MIHMMMAFCLHINYMAGRWKEHSSSLCAQITTSIPAESIASWNLWRENVEKKVSYQAHSKKRVCENDFVLQAAQIKKLQIAKKNPHFILEGFLETHSRKRRRNLREILICTLSKQNLQLRANSENKMKFFYARSTFYN